MASLFSTPKVQQPAPLPPSPLSNELKIQERDAATASATADAAAGGRRSTVFAGRSMAMAKQKDRVKNRGVVDELLS